MQKMSNCSCEAYKSLSRIFTVMVKEFSSFVQEALRYPSRHGLENKLAEWDFRSFYTYVEQGQRVFCHHRFKWQKKAIEWFIRTCKRTRKMVLSSTELVHWVKEMDTSEWVFPRVYEGENPFPSVPFLSRMESSLVEDGILFHVAVMFSEWLFCFHGVKTTQEWVEQLPL